MQHFRRTRSVLWCCIGAPATRNSLWRWIVGRMLLLATIARRKQRSVDDGISKFALHRPLTLQWLRFCCKRSFKKSQNMHSALLHCGVSEKVSGLAFAHTRMFEKNEVLLGTALCTDHHQYSTDQNTNSHATQKIYESNERSTVA